MIKTEMGKTKIEGSLQEIMADITCIMISYKNFLVEKYGKENAKQLYKQTKSRVTSFKEM